MLTDIFTLQTALCQTHKIVTETHYKMKASKHGYKDVPQNIFNIYEGGFHYEAQKLC